MIDGAGMCWGECPLYVYYRPNRCGAADTMDGEVCPVWARRTAKELSHLKDSLKFFGYSTPLAMAHRIVELEAQLAEARAAKGEAEGHFENLELGLDLAITRTKQLEEQLAEAQKDSERLDWLIDDFWDIPGPAEEREPFPGDGDEVVMLFADRSLNNFRGSDLRSAVRATIDAAKEEVTP